MDHETSPGGSTYDRDELVARISLDPSGQLLVLRELVECEPDQAWLETYLVQIVESGDLPEGLRRMAIWSLGDVVRSRRKLHDHSVTRVLWRALGSPELAEAADMALGDIELNHGWRGQFAGRHLHRVCSAVRRLSVRTL